MWLVARLVVLPLALLSLTLAAGGCGLEGDAEPAAAPALTISGLYPAFNRQEVRYVSRCGRGAPPIRLDAADGVRVRVGSQAFISGSREIGSEVPPGADFRLTVLDQGRRSGYRVRCLPADFPDWSFESVRPSPPTLFTVGFQASADARPWIIVFDSHGVPRWWYSPDTRALWGQILAGGALQWARSFGDGYGLDPRMAHEVRSASGQLLRLVRTGGSIVDGHEFRELANGNVLLDSYVPETADLRRVGGPRRAAVVSAEIQELDPRGRVRWRWNSRGHIGLRETGRWWRNVLSNSRRRLQGRATFDPVHINSIEPRGSDEVVISTRHTDAVYGISRSTGEIRWKLGGSETGKSLRVVGDPARRLLGGQHDARIGSDGRLSIYDNAKDRPRRPRVVFYRLDLEDRTAHYLGQLNDPAVKESHCCGSAREVAGGGWLVSWGDNPLVSGFDSKDRLAFRLELAASTFRAVPAPAGSTSVAELDRGLEAMEAPPGRSRHIDSPRFGPKGGHQAVSAGVRGAAHVSTGTPRSKHRPARLQAGVQHARPYELWRSARLVATMERGALMATAVALDSSPANVLRSMRGSIIDARLGYPEVLHVEIKDSAGERWLLATQDADWTPTDPSQLVGQSIEDAEIDEDSGELRCKLSNGSLLDVKPARKEADDDPPNWELITPGGVLLEFGPGVRWQISSADEPTSSRR